MERLVRSGDCLKSTVAEREMKTPFRFESENAGPEVRFAFAPPRLVHSSHSLGANNVTQEESRSI
jgi:hypothetical protein